MRYTHCRIPGCLSRRDRGIKFFTYKDQWESIIRENCGERDCKLPKQSPICERHFENRFLKKFHLRVNDNEILTDHVLIRGAYPTIFYNDLLSQVGPSSHFMCGSNENNEVYEDSRISNPTLSVQSEAKSNSNILSAELSNTSSPITFESNEVSLMDHSESNGKILKKRPKERRTYDGPVKKCILSTAAGPSRFDSDLLEREITNIHDSKRWFEAAHDNKEPVIKSENDQVEELTNGGQIEQIYFSDIKMEDDAFQSVMVPVMPSNREESCEADEKRNISIDTQIKVVPSRFDGNVSINEIPNECSSIVTQSNSCSTTKHKIHNNHKAVDMFKFGSELFVDHILKKNYRSIEEDIQRAAGPSRLNNDLLNDAINFSELHQNGERIPQEDILIKKEVIDDQAEEIRETNCGGALLNETEIKKEKLDDEENTNEINLHSVKIENPVENYFLLESEEAEKVKKSENSSEDIYTSIAKMKGERFLKEVALYNRVIKCILCDIYLKKPLKDHIVDCHQLGIFFLCPYCDDSGIIKSGSLEKEVQRHSEILQLNCEFCNGTFRNWIDLSLHLDVEHEEMMSTICSICGYNAESYGILIQHIVLSHEGQTLTHACQDCNFTTMNASLLQFHTNAKHTANSVTTLVSSNTITQPKKNTRLYKKLPKKCPCCDFVTWKRTLRKHIDETHGK